MWAWPLFCRGFDHGTRKRDLERRFSKYGTVSRIDMKSDIAYIYFETTRDAEEAIRRLDNAEFGHRRRRLTIQWSRTPDPRNRDRPTRDDKPKRTLFVACIDSHTKPRDIEKHFEPYGKITNIRIRHSFAFVEYETQEEASKAVKHTDQSTILDSVVTVQYAYRDANERDDRYGSPKRGDRGTPRGTPYRRSPSQRDYSPEYDRRSRNPGYDRRERAPCRRSRSPDYGHRYERSRSPRNGRY